MYGINKGFRYNEGIVLSSMWLKTTEFNKIKNYKSINLNFLYFFCIPSKYKCNIARMMSNAAKQSCVQKTPGEDVLCRHIVLY